MTVRQLVVALIVLLLLLPACGRFIRVGQTPIPGPTLSPTATGTGLPAGSEFGGPAPGELPVTEGPDVTG